MKQLTAGLDAELVSLAIGSEPLNSGENLVYRDGLEKMASGARAALVGLQTAAARLEREAEKAQGG